MTDSASADILMLDPSSGEIPEKLAAGAYKICWVKVNWTERHTCGEACDDLMGKWLSKECSDDTCPWDEDTVYGYPCPDSRVGFCKVMVHSITPCTTSSTPPEDD